MAGGERLGVASRGIVGNGVQRRGDGEHDAVAVRFRDLLARRDGGRGQAERAEVTVDVDQVRAPGRGRQVERLLGQAEQARGVARQDGAFVGVDDARGQHHVERGLDGRAGAPEPNRNRSAPTWLTTVSRARKCARRLVSRNRCGQRVERGQAIAELACSAHR